MRRTIPVLSLLVLVVCGPDRGDEPSQQGERYALAVCAAFHDCGCERRYASEGTCVEVLSSRFDRALRDGLVIVEDCFERTVTHAVIDDCGAWGDYPPVEWCQVFRGRARGEPCGSAHRLPGLFAGACDAGLECATSGVCVEAGTTQAPQAKREGDTCEVFAYWSCGSPGLYCAYDGRCRRVQDELGASCDAVRSCGSYSSWYCKGEHMRGHDGVCSEREEMGAPCDHRDFLPCSDGWCDPEESICVPWDNVRWVCRESHLPESGPWPPA